MAQRRTNAEILAEIRKMQAEVQELRIKEAVAAERERLYAPAAPEPPARKPAPAGPERVRLTTPDGAEIYATLRRDRGRSISIMIDPDDLL